MPTRSSKSPMVVPQSASHSPIGSPTSEARSHRKLASATSIGPLDTTDRLLKRKSWQPSETSYTSGGWSDTPAHWEREMIPPHDWDHSSSVDSSFVQITPARNHNSISPQVLGPVDDEQLHPNRFELSSHGSVHKPSPASSARNSIQSTVSTVPVATPTALSSFESSPGKPSLDDTMQPSHAHLQLNPGPENHPLMAHAYSQAYPGLSLQTQQLSQPQAPRSDFSAHYAADPHSFYRPGQYPFSYEPFRPPMDQSSIQAGAPPTIYSPVLQHAPQPHDFFRRQQPQSFYPDYLASPIAAQPPQPYYWSPPQTSLPWNPQSPLVASQNANSMNFGPGNIRRRDAHGGPRNFHSQQHANPGGSAMRSTPSSQPFTAASFAPLSVRGPVQPARQQFVPRNNALQATHPTTHAINRFARKERRDARPVARSALLDEYRSKKNDKWEIEDIVGHIAEFSCDQLGSRFIQDRIATANETARELVYQEIIPSNVLKLARDVFGNYVLQKMMEHGTLEERAVVVQTLEPQLVALSFDMYGCRVVQKMVDYLSPAQQAQWISELRSHILDCVKDINGNHVIQKLLESVPAERPVFVATFLGHIHDLAGHPHGCRVLQRCFEHAGLEACRPLLTELHERTITLMQDQYGNYVVQFILENGTESDRTLVIERLVGRMVQMSKHKFASNVCEKALTVANSHQLKQLVEEIMLPRSDGMNPIITMIKDQYANYVLQQALQATEGELLDALVTTIRPHILNMRRYTNPFNKHISSLERILKERGIDIHSVRYKPNNKNGEKSDSSTPTPTEANPGHR